MKTFDYNRAMEVTDGDTHLFHELVQIFNSQLQQNLMELDIALSNGDAAHVELVAHGLKGALSNLGALQAADLASSLEMAAHQKNLTAAKKRVEDLADEIDNFRETVKNVQD